MRGRAVPKRFPAKAVFHRAAGSHDPHDPPQLLAGAGGGGRRPGRRAPVGAAFPPARVRGRRRHRHPGQRQRNLLCPPGGGQAGTGRHVRHPGGGGEGSPGHLGGALRLLSGGPGSRALRTGTWPPISWRTGPVVAVECSLDPESALQPGALFLLQPSSWRRRPPWPSCCPPCLSAPPPGRFQVRGGASWRSITRKYPPCSRWRPGSAGPPPSPWCWPITAVRAPGAGAGGRPASPGDGSNAGNLLRAAPTGPGPGGQGLPHGPEGPSEHPAPLRSSTGTSTTLWSTRAARASGAISTTRRRAGRRLSQAELDEAFNRHRPVLPAERGGPPGRKTPGPSPTSCGSASVASTRSWRPWPPWACCWWCPGSWCPCSPSSSSTRYLLEGNRGWLAGFCALLGGCGRIPGGAHRLPGLDAGPAAE